jgi:copper ion binding protein
MNTTITVSGMTCGHCVNSVTEELKKITGVSEVQVDLETGKVEITSSTELAPGEISHAITEAGYELK